MLLKIHKLEYAKTNYGIRLFSGQFEEGHFIFY